MVLVCCLHDFKVLKFGSLISVTIHVGLQKSGGVDVALKAMEIVKIKDEF